MNDVEIVITGKDQSKSAFDSAVRNSQVATTRIQEQFRQLDRSMKVAGVAAGAAFGSALVGGAGAAVATIGLAGFLLREEPAVKAAASELMTSVSQTFESAAQPLAAPIADALHSITVETQKLEPQLRSLFSASAGLVQPLTNGLTGLVANVLPGVTRAIQGMTPVFRVLEQQLPEIGNAISGVFETIGDIGPDIAHTLDIFLDIVTLAINATGELIGLLGPLAPAILTVVSAFKTFSVITSAAAVSMKAFNSVVSANPIVALGTAAFAAGYGIAYLFDTMLKNNSVGDDFSSWVSETDSSISQLTGDSKFLGGTLTELTDTARHAAGDFGLFTDVMNILNESGLRVNDTAGWMTETFANWGETAEETGEAVAGGLSEIEEAAEDAQQAIDDLHGAISGMIDESFELERAEDAVAEQIIELTDAIKEQHKAGEAGAGTLNRNTEAGRQNAEMARSLTEKYGELAVAQQRAGKPIDDVKSKLYNQLVALGLSRSEAAAYASKLDGVKYSLDRIPAYVKKETDFITRHITIQQETDRETRRQYRRTGGIATAATGGVRGGGVIVGEDGPELVQLPQGSKVYPHGQSMAMLGSSTGSNMQISVTAAPGAAQAFVTWIISMLQFEVSANGGSVQETLGRS